MSMSDPIADFLTRVRNAIKAEKKIVDIPASNLKQELARILKENNYITDFKLHETDNKQGAISIYLKYNSGKSVIAGLKRSSRPGLRNYVKTDDIPRVRNGLGIAVMSTSKGVMTDKQARNMQIGGEVICEVW
ncbi:MAG: 30S ribosomal protein S8 [Ignavibacteriae bacterium]|nr:30S ribosomal protein S8 [Ignavibacteriota bacterium]MCB9242772.1 30S ribosomal protein S8 [Ignavibacteriales bacterium]